MLRKIKSNAMARAGEIIVNEPTRTIKIGKYDVCIWLSWRHPVIGVYPRVFDVEKIVDQDYYNWMEYSQVEE